MKVPYDEGLANHVSPESCGGCGNKTAEALTGENAGGPLSSEITTARVPTLWLGGEGNIRRSAKRELRWDPAESENLACVEASWAGIERSEKFLSFKAGIGESRVKNLQMHRRWLCSGGNDEQEIQSTSEGLAGEGAKPYVQFIKLL